MTTTYTHISDLAKEAQPPEKGILSRTLYNDEKVKGVIFGFGQGEELSEHTASMPAILHFLQGEAKLTLGDDTLEAKPGTWVHMPTGQIAVAAVSRSRNVHSPGSGFVSDTTAAPAGTRWLHRQRGRQPSH